jgi:hypothetical protein
MTAMGFQMKPSDVSEARRAGAVQAEWSGVGWIDSSWELAHGLEVVEDLPPDAWPLQENAPTTPPARS